MRTEFRRPKTSRWSRARRTRRRRPQLRSHATRRAARVSTSSSPGRSSTKALAGTSGLRSAPGRRRSLAPKKPGAARCASATSRRSATSSTCVTSARAYELLLEPSVPAGTYNVAGGRTVEMREVLELLLGLANAPIEVEPDPALMRPADLPVVCGDASRLRDATGWEPMIPLEQTLADTLDAARRATTRMASA